MFVKFREKKEVLLCCTTLYLFINNTVLYNLWKHDWEDIVQAIKRGLFMSKTSVN